MRWSPEDHRTVRWAMACATVIVVAALVYAAAAEGASMRSPYLSRALSAARAYWGEYPVWCPRGPVVFEVPAEALVFDWEGQRVHADGRAESHGCKMWLRERLMEPGWERQDWPWFCMVVVHEYGHLLGYGHDRTPSRPFQTVRVCNPNRFKRAFR